MSAEWHTCLVRLRYWIALVVGTAVMAGACGTSREDASVGSSPVHWVERLRVADSVAAMSFETVEQLQLVAPRIASSGRIAEAEWEPARCETDCESLANPLERYPSVRFSVTLDDGEQAVLRSTIAPVLSKEEVSAIARNAVGSTVVVARPTGEVRPELTGAVGLDRPVMARADDPTVDPNALLVLDGDRWRSIGGGEVVYARRGEPATRLAERINTADRQLDRGEIPVSSVIATLRD